MPYKVNGSTAQGTSADSLQTATNQTRARGMEYFIPGDGIDRAVITTDICRYLGNDAIVRPGAYDDNGRIIQGYYIVAYRNFTQQMIEDLKQDSAKWSREQRHRPATSRPARYADSSTARESRAHESIQHVEYRGYYSQSDHHGDPGYHAGGPARYPDSSTAGPTQPVDYRGYSSQSGRHGDPAYHAGGPFSDSGYGTASCPSRKAAESVTVQTGPDLDDVATVYSDAMSASDFRVGAYISAVAEDLARKLGSTTLDLDDVNALTAVLPKLLKVLALKIGYNAPSQMHRDVMFFLHKHRNGITEAFREHCSGQTEERQEPEAVREGKPLSGEAIKKWLDAVDDEYEPLSNDVKTDHELEGPADGTAGEEDELDIPGLEEYRGFLANEPVYGWLLQRLRRELLTSQAEPDSSDVMGQIRDKITRAISRYGNHRITRRESSAGCQIRYYVDWQPLEFLEDQEYGLPNEQAIAQAITLTGSAKDAQALNCDEYLEQTWPSTGGQILRLIRDIVRVQDDPDRVDTCQRKTPTGTTLSGSLIESRLVIEASGIPDLVAEVGEQLAWMGAALRPSPRTTAPVTCTPFIESNSATNFHIRFNFEDCHTSEDDPGRCWYGLFRNPVIVRGFPIAKKSALNTGLEIPLNVMASLVQTGRVDKFNSKLFLKGFSAMLVPTRRWEDVLVWHLVRSQLPTDHISYWDYSSHHADVAIHDLQKVRHVVGWCPDGVFSIGNLSANYDVERSGLPRVSSGCLLEKAEISGGQFITATVGFSLGKRDKPIHISRSGYLTRLEWISSKHVIFWDEEEQKGWLANGASALLHILRGGLENSRSRLKSAFLLNPSQLKDADDPNDAGAAFEVLLNQENRELKLYVEKSELIDEEIRDGKGGTQTISKRVTTFHQLQDRVEHIYNILEKLIEHQADVDQKSGWQLKPRVRSQLEGWDFKDLATGADPFYPRVATFFQPLDRGWVDLARKIHAVTLFGRGFGELIEPRYPEGKFCSYWSRLPSKRYLLAARVADLQAITEHDGQISNPIVTCENMCWDLKMASQPCPCLGGKNPKHHHDLAIIPLSFKRNGNPGRAQSTGPTHGHGGAVILSHQSAFSLFKGRKADSHTTSEATSGEGGSSTFRDSSGLTSNTSASASRVTSPGETWELPEPSNARSVETGGSQSPTKEKRRSAGLRRSIQRLASSVKNLKRAG